MLVRVGDRDQVERTLAGLRLNFRAFHLAWPTDEEDCTACGYDEFTDSPKDIACKVCGGIGKIIAWATMEVNGRLQYYDFVKLSAAGLPPGIEIGDVVVYVSESVKDAIGEVRASQLGYVLVDGDTYRVYSINPTGVGHADEWRIELKRSQVDVRAAGY